MTTLLCRSSSPANIVRHSKTVPTSSSLAPVLLFQPTRSPARTTRRERTSSLEVVAASNSSSKSSLSPVRRRISKNRLRASVMVTRRRPMYMPRRLNRVKRRSWVEESHDWLSQATIELPHNLIWIIPNYCYSFCPTRWAGCFRCRASISDPTTPKRCALGAAW